MESDTRDTGPGIVLAAIKADLVGLEDLLDRASSHWAFEDGFYRFYHQSFKVFALQQSTLEIVAKLQSLWPGRELNKWFLAIIADGTGRKFVGEDNQRWLDVTRPILEANLHARTMLEFAVKYGRELDAPPDELPSGWAALLYLFCCR